MDSALMYGKKSPLSSHGDISLFLIHTHRESTPSFLCTPPTIPLRVCACACYKQKIHSDSRWGDGCHAAPCFPWLSKNRKEEESDGEAERWQRIGSGKGKMLRETLGLNWSVRVEKKDCKWIRFWIGEAEKWWTLTWGTQYMTAVRARVQVEFAEMTVKNN